MMNRTQIAASILSLALGTTSPALAGKVSVNPTGPIFAPTPQATQPPEADPGTVDFVVKGLQSAQQFCGQLSNKQYTVDCISERLSTLARQMPETGEYADARAALLDASRKLNDLAVANRSTTVPRARASRTGTTPVRTSRALTPVRLDRLEQVNQQATAILQEAETILLRSADSSATRQINYARIAEAVGSNKLLLRSL